MSTMPSKEDLKKEWTFELLTQLDNATLDFIKQAKQDQLHDAKQQKLTKAQNI